MARAAYDAVKLEVNHVAPLAGAKRAAPCCAHHLENLETLCSGCHAQVTAEQSAARAAVRRESKLAAAIAAMIPVMVPLEHDRAVVVDDRRLVQSHLAGVRRNLHRALRAYFVRATFDFAGRRLVGREGVALQWFLPDDPATVAAVVVTRTAGAA